jgi:hypothetical protein
MCFDSEPATCTTVTYPRARKQHRCGECRGTIAAGEVYVRVTGISDGSAFTHKECRRCCYDRKRIVQHELAEGCHWSESQPPCGHLLDALQERDMEQTPWDAMPADYQVTDSPYEE